MIYLKNKKMLAIDLGASSGRGIIGSFDGNKITLEEIHRFSNDPVVTENGFYWDTLRILFEIKSAINKSILGGYNPSTMGIDTWGIDYGYLDKTGALLSNPYNYRDTRTTGLDKYVFDNIMSQKELYELTGIQNIAINTIYQMLSDIKTRPWIVDNAERMLNMPDLLAYLLTGNKSNEYTIASTGALLDPYKRDFSASVLKKLGIPEKLFEKPVMPGTSGGKLLQSVCEETGASDLELIKIGSHDTASAVLAVPADNNDFLYISSGTWSLMGIESDEPVISDESFKYNFTNEGGVFGKIRVLKNIMGLWIEQESRRQWKREGKNYSFDDLSEMATSSKPFLSFINPDDPVFTTSGNMPARIREYCKNTNQTVPESDGAVVRCILESLALKYRWTSEKIEEITSRKYSTINIVGGGTKERMLSEFTASASGKRVVCGPVEATALGNIAMQAYYLGELGSIQDIRNVVRNSTDISEIQPDLSSKNEWDEAYERFIKLL